MSHRRRFLNLVTRNWVTGVYSLRRIDLHSRQNNLFYPTPAAAEEAAAAHDPSALFADGGDKGPRKVALKKVPRIHVPAPAQSFQLCNGSSAARDRSMDCVALSESETVFLDLDHTSRHPRGAFVYDAGRRCVVSLPNPHASMRYPICLSLTSAGADDSKHDTVYVLERFPSSSDTEEEEERIQFQTLVHQKVYLGEAIYEDRWRCDELPPPPGYWGTGIGSHAVIGSASDVICISTEGIGTYCFDTASREWSKAGDWERDPGIGIWAGFLEFYRSDEAHRLCVTADLFSDEDRHRVTLCRDAALVLRDDCRELEPPLGWCKEGLSALAPASSASSSSSRPGRACTECQHEEVEDKFAVFTGVEVMRCAKDDEGVGDELRIVVHKSKRYMLTNFTSTINFVL